MVGSGFGGGDSTINNLMSADFGRSDPIFGLKSTCLKLKNSNAQEFHMEYSLDFTGEIVND